MISKEDLNVLRDMSREIIADAKELRRLEEAEQKREARRGSILRSLSKAQSSDGIQERTEFLRKRLIQKQQEYLVEQADLERRIAEIPNHYVRTVLSMAFVDLLTYDEAAAVIGGRATGGGMQALINRFFYGRRERHDRP